MNEHAPEKVDSRRSKAKNWVIGVTVMGAATVYPNEVAAFARNGIDFVANPHAHGFREILIAVPAIVWGGYHACEDFLLARQLISAASKSFKLGLGCMIKANEQTILQLRHTPTMYFYV